MRRGEDPPDMTLNEGLAAMTDPTAAQIVGALQNAGWLPNLTAEDVRREVEAILAIYGDQERGHGEEDDLLEKVIRQLAGTSDVAAALLPLLDANRERWYA